MVRSLSVIGLHCLGVDQVSEFAQYAEDLEAAVVRERSAPLPPMLALQDEVGNRAVARLVQHVRTSTPAPIARMAELNPQRRRNRRRRPGPFHQRELGMCASVRSSSVTR